ncbi:MAG: hypothetical protein WCQ21_24600 [Verrucomicrobiota bacterium]
MDWKFQREHHIRQDKAKKPSYREEMVLHPRSPPPPTPPAPKFKIQLTLRRNFDEVSPPVAAALRCIEPAIDFRRLIEAINSRLGETACKLHCELELPKIIAAIRTAFPAKQTPSRHIAMQFLQWHDKVAEAYFQCPSAAIQVPQNFHGWLHKLTTPPNSATLIAPSSFTDQLSVPSSPPNPAL